MRSKPFTPRSIVGMTQGARKRAARAELIGAHQVGTLSEIPAGIVRDVYRGPHYRIGQRLRPCVGCLRCKCRSAFDAWPELGEELAKDHPTCDGSGVLLARKPK